MSSCAASAPPDDAAAAGAAACRFCLEFERLDIVDGEPDRPTRVCSCRGSVGLAHVACLYRWIRTRPALGALRCELCRQPYLRTDYWPPLAPPAEVASGVVFSLLMAFISLMAAHSAFRLAMGRNGEGSAAVEEFFKTHFRHQQQNTTAPPLTLSVELAMMMLAAWFLWRAVPCSVRNWMMRTSSSVVYSYFFSVLLSTLLFELLCSKVGVSLDPLVSRQFIYVGFGLMMTRIGLGHVANVGAVVLQGVL